jgi:hypothetical protein
VECSPRAAAKAYRYYSGAVMAIAQLSPAERLAAILAEADRIAALELPYFWGGGHLDPAPADGPFDCSSAVCRVLQAAGYELRTTWSGELVSWGSPGPGVVTIYGNLEHVFLAIGGRYWGTSERIPGGGPGWLDSLPDSSAFTARHPADLPYGAVDGGLRKRGLSYRRRNRR